MILCNIKYCCEYDSASHHRFLVVQSIKAAFESMLNPILVLGHKDLILTNLLYIKVEGFS